MTRSDWTTSVNKRWARRLEWLTRRHPLALPVTVRWHHWRREFGRTDIYADRIVIRIARRLDYSTAVYTLLEEWAHALAGPGEAHSDAWGLMYARLIRADERYSRKRGKRHV